MTITTTEIQKIMEEFYHRNRRLPNAILLPASERIHGITSSDLTTIQLEACFGARIIYAAITHPRAAIL